MCLVNLTKKVFIKSLAFKGFSIYVDEIVKFNQNCVFLLFFVKNKFVV